jgi:hypothetical protein
MEGPSGRARWPFPVERRLGGAWASRDRETAFDAMPSASFLTNLPDAVNLLPAAAYSR